MALYNSLQDARINQGILRRFAMQQDAPAPQLAGEVQASFDVLDTPPELEFLFSRFLCSGTAFAPAVATKFAGCTLFNPLNSGRVCVVHQITISSGGTASLFVIGQIGAAIASGGGVIKHTDYRDSRATGTPSCTMEANGDTPALGGTQGRIYCALPANGTQVIPYPWVFFPGSGLEAQNTVANLPIYVNVLFTERQYLPSEVG